MKKYLVILSAFLLLLGLSGVANAYSISYNYGLSGNQFISPYQSYPGFLTATFDSFLGSSGSNWAVVQGTTGSYAAPMGFDGINRDNTPYLTVPQNVNSIPQAYDSGLLINDFNYFGLWWGSIDTYNKLEFFLNGQLIATIIGSDVSTATGNQTIYDTNKYVNIFFDSQYFDSFKMTSTQYAFEVDNITVGVVPEPATLLLLGFGLFGLAGVTRRLKK